MRKPLVSTGLALCMIAGSFSAAPAPSPSRGLNVVVRTLVQLDDPMAQADVLRGMTAAVKGRRQVAMPDGWRAAYAKLQKSENADVRQLAVGLALTFGDADAIAELRRRAADAKAAPAQRLLAVDALAEAHDGPLGPILLSLLDTPALADVAVRDLAAYSEPATAVDLVDRYPKFTPSQKRDAINTLASRAAWGTALLGAVEKGKIPRADISALTIRQLSTLNDATLADRLKKDYGSVRPHGKDKAALIATYKKTFTPDLLAKANLSHGRLVFSKTCGVCHTLFDAGGKLGPSLTGSQRANLDYILEKVTDPSAVVPKENYMAIIETNDGRTITGIVAAETDKTITVRDTTQDLTLAKSDIKSRKSSPTSMMPEGLLEAMSTSDARDLIGYLQSASQAPMEK